MCGILEVCRRLAVPSRAREFASRAERPVSTDDPLTTTVAVDSASWRAPPTSKRKATTMQILDTLDAASLRTDIPDFRPGDTLKVHVRVVEGNRERVQIFQGVVIRRQGGGVRETFTIRKVSFGVGVERTFPVHTPIVAKLELVSRGAVRRAKLYYLRELRGKAAKIKEKRDALPTAR